MNPKISCIIVDDEPPAIRVLEKLISLHPDLECVATTHRAIEALELVNTLQPNLLLLDIQMPELTGLQLSTLLKGQTQIIFTTAYAQYALEGFEVNALDYLLKPISFDRLVKSIEKFKNFNSHAKTPVQQAQTKEEFFFIKTDGKNKFKKIEFDEILFIESVKNNLIIHTSSQEIITYNTLKYFEENLPKNQFIQIHKSYIISLDKITKTDNQEVWVGTKILPIGETYKEEFFKKINQKLL